MGDEYVSLQTLLRPDGTLTLHRCHSEKQPNKHLLAAGHEYQVPSAVHRAILQNACSKREYLVKSPDDAVTVYHDSDIETVPDLFAHIHDHDENSAARTNESMASFIMHGIYPGTKWCGIGNMAHDIYGDLGEHPDVDACCRAHDLCRPNLEPFATRYHLSNPSMYSLLHCSCDVALYNCFRTVNTPVSREIGRIFFNLVKMKCFDFDFKSVCRFSVLGFCLSKETRCGAVLRDNPQF